MSLEDLWRPLGIRALKTWGGLRGDIQGRMSTDIQPVLVLDNGLPVYEPWSFTRQKVGVAAQNAHVGIYNKDPRPEDTGGAQGGGGSIVRIDHICFSTGGASDIVVGVIDSTNVASPASAASMLAAWQPVKNPPYKVTGVGFADASPAGVFGDQTIPHAGLAAGTPHHIDLEVFLGPGHAFVIGAQTTNTTITVWARGRYYSAP